ISAPPLFEAIAHESELRIGSFNDQGLANTAWAFATLGTPAPQLFDAIARESEQRVGSLEAQGLANTAWAFAPLGIPAPRLFDVIARESEQRISTFEAQGLANTAWAFATLGTPTPRLFEVIARESEQRVGSFEAQGLANTAWAFATLGVPAPQLFKAIARESEQRIGSFNPQNLANTAWSFAIVGTGDRGALVKAVTARATEIGSAAFTHEGRCQLHQFCLGVELKACAPAELLAPIELRDACRQAMAGAKTPYSSKLHKDVSNEPTRMGIAHANDLYMPRLGYHAVRAATAKYAGIVIEVDGPTHYDDERRLRPALEMIRRHLTLAGWAVLGVPYWEWNEPKAKGQVRKRKYLAKLLARAVSGPVHS
ncbi:hypothetical protein T492DRAFT_597322, partial [Pavlovales sp. CCMP2436]